MCLLCRPVGRWRQLGVAITVDLALRCRLLPAADQRGRIVGRKDIHTHTSWREFVKEAACRIRLGRRGRDEDGAIALARC